MLYLPVTMKWQFAQFVVRWAVNTAGLFTASLLLSGVTYQDQWQVLVLGALILSIINALIKPFVIILALPALVLSLGIFSIVINGAMVYLAHVLYPPFQVSGFFTAILAGLIIGLVNYIVTWLFDTFLPREQSA